jgi:hypothetical protein
MASAQTAGDSRLQTIPALQRVTWSSKDCIFYLLDPNKIGISYYRSNREDMRTTNEMLLISIFHVNVANKMRILGGCCVAIYISGQEIQWHCTCTFKLTTCTHFGTIKQWKKQNNFDHSYSYRSSPSGSSPFSRPVFQTEVCGIISAP